MLLDPNVNRVSVKIHQCEDTIAQRLVRGEVIQRQLDDINKALCMELGEYCRFQELKSFAVAAGTLTLEEGQTIYGFLGESVETFNSRPIAVKAVLTKVFQELLSMQIPPKRRKR